MMEVVMPFTNTGNSAMDSYEDMFKEITRKLYGEEGLPDIINSEKLTNVPSANEKVLSNLEYEVDSSIFKPDEHITAFGLAALMQNGFSSNGMLNSSLQQNKLNSASEDKWITNENSLHWTQSKIASYNPSQNLFKCTDCECVGYLIRVAEHWLGSHANLRVFQCPECPYASAWARCVRMHITRQHNINSEETVDTLLKENPVMNEITRYLQTLKTKFEMNSTKNLSVIQSSLAENQNKMQNNNSTRALPSTATSLQNIAENSNNTNVNINTKRYACNYCPYATDRRDLFTRHENIHREEKPFLCYVCQKQFNRADHVKKHFLRMHREHPYDLNRIRRQPPKNASGMSYYKYNNNDVTNSTTESTHNMQQVLQHQLTIPNGFSTINRANQNVPITRMLNSQNPKTSSVKLNTSKSSCKKRGDKRYSCCYCSWSGVDNWCLKRHLNTHLKPFVCGLCDYKAARSERLATHVLKVHNKRACGRCLYLADDQAQLLIHQQEHHSMEHKNSKSNSILRSSTYSCTQLTPANQSFGHSNNSITSSIKTYELSAAIFQHGNRLLPVSSNFLPNTTSKPWKSYTPKQHGAARLFNYMEASDGSDLECDTNMPNTDINITSNTTNKNHLDFIATEETSIQNHEEQEDFGEDIELPLFICRECGCEFIDDISLETHIYTYHQVEKISSSSESKQISNSNVRCKKQLHEINSFISKKSHLDCKENVNPKHNYICMVCKTNFNNQIHVMNHMRSHVNLSYKKKEISGKKSFATKKSTEFMEESHTISFYHNVNSTFKRSRKQSQPRKVVLPFYENQEIQVMKGTSLKNKQWQHKNGTCGNISLRLREKYMNKLITRKGYNCNLCKKTQHMFPYYTKNSLAVHYIFKHMNVKKFECEHCFIKFRHRYQVVLHSSRHHVNNLSAIHVHHTAVEFNKQVLSKINSKNTLCNDAPLSHQQITTDADVVTTEVPDNSTSNMCIDKLSIHSFLEQSVINPNSSVNNMPITIPTFPPS